MGFAVRGGAFRASKQSSLDAAEFTGPADDAALRHAPARCGAPGRGGRVPNGDAERQRPRSVLLSRPRGRVLDEDRGYADCPAPHQATRCCRRDTYSPEAYGRVPTTLDAL